MTEQEVIERLQSKIEEAGGQKAFAEKHGFAVAYVNDVVRGKRGLAERILASIGVERSIVYRVKDESL